MTSLMTTMTDVFYAIAAALTGSVAYAFFSKEYDPLVEEVELPEFCAAILYGLAAIILLFATSIAALVLGINVGLPTETDLWNTNYNNSGSLTITLLISILVMAVAYAVHIVSEAHARENTSIATYSIIFQINVIIIALLQIILNDTAVNLLMVVGGATILLASTGAFINSSGVIGKATTPLLLICTVSAVSCGCASFIDGNISSQVILYKKSIGENLPFFLGYEFLTFALPCFLTILSLWIRLKNTVFQTIYKVYKRHKYPFLKSAFFSVIQFVTSVYALSFSEHRLVVAAMLGTAPIFSVLIDKNPQKKRASCLHGRDRQTATHQEYRGSGTSTRKRAE